MAVVLADAGVRTEVVADPWAEPRLLVAAAVLPEDLTLIASRSRDGCETVVWGGTLPVPRVAQLRASGAVAYVSLLQPPSELLAVVTAALAGEGGDWGADPGPMTELTGRELAVARAYLVDQAEQTRAEVARTLGISERTLKAHVANIRAKAGHRGTDTREGLRRALTVRGSLP